MENDKNNLPKLPPSKGNEQDDLIRPWRLKPDVKKKTPTINSIRELARKASPMAIHTLVKIMEDEKANKLHRIIACNSLLDRGYGKPSQEYRISEKAPEEDNLAQLSDDELERLREIKKKLSTPIVEENPPVDGEVVDAEYEPPPQP